MSDCTERVQVGWLLPDGDLVGTHEKASRCRDESWRPVFRGVEEGCIWRCEHCGRGRYALHTEASDE